MFLPAREFEVEIRAPGDLSAADVAIWDDIRAEEPAFADPLFSAGFAQAVGRVRRDAAVAVYRRNGRAVGFLAHHRRPGGFGRPIGAPFADYHGLVARRGEGPAGCDALGLAGLKAFRHNGLADPFAAFSGLTDGSPGYAVELDGDSEAYLESLRAASPKKFKNWRRLRHRLAELGPLTIRASRDRADFDRLMDWKRAQFVRTGVQDVLKPAWTRGLMDLLFAETVQGVSGLMVTLHAGDRLAAGHFGPRQGSIYHPWIASTDPDLAAASPGQAFLHEVIRAMPTLGLTAYDLGSGHDHYKLPFVNATRALSSGLSIAPGRAGGLVRARERSWAVAGRSAAVDKVRRRLDHIAATDPSLTGRIGGVVEAAMAMRHRSLVTDAATPE